LREGLDADFSRRRFARRLEKGVITGRVNL
jgi:hypothetical protein